MEADKDKTARARERWSRLGLGSVGVGIARLSEPRHERARAQDGRAAERIGALLELHLRDAGVVLLPDRAIAGGRASIDLLAIGPGGVTVIAAESGNGRLRIESRSGLLRPRDERLLIDGRDRSALVEDLRRQIALVTAALAKTGESAGVRGAICVADVDELPLRGGLQVGDIAVDGPRRVARIATRPGPLAAADVGRIALALAVVFPPA
jgi:hypothetical protein